MVKSDSESVEGNKNNDVKVHADELTFGMLLKGAREQAGFSIERAAMATRITLDFIEAMEKDNLSRLPGAVFGRGFIRNLCKVYGCDSAALLIAYDRMQQQIKGKDASLSHRDEKRHQQLKKGVLLIQPNEWKGRIKALAPHHYLRAKPLLIMTAVGLSAALLYSAAQGFLRNDEEISSVARVEEPSPSPKLEESQAVKPEAEPMEASQTASLPSVNPAPVSAAGVATVKSEEKPAAAAPDGVADVEILVKEAVNVKITRDNDKPITGELAPDRYRYRFKESLKVFIEDVSLVEISFRGQKIPTSTVKGESKRMTFQSAEGLIAKKPGSSTIQ